MRNKLVSGFDILYPEQIVWIGDHNYITVSNPTHSVGCEIKITHPTGTEKTLRYFSELNTLSFNLDDVLIELHDDNISNYGCSVIMFANGVQSANLSFVFKVLYGKSFENRSHGCEQVINIYNSDELNKLQVYSPQNATAYIEGQTFQTRIGINAFNLSSIITDDGSYQICISNGSVNPSVNITNDIHTTPTSTTLVLAFDTGGGGSETEKGGTIWKDKTIFPICHTINFVSHCDDFDFIELRYTNTDGCERFIGGKIIEETNISSYTPYRRNFVSHYANTTKAYITGNERTVKIGLPEVESSAYIQDILLSETVWYRNYNGDWKQCRMKTDKLTNNNTTTDYEIEIIISEE